MQDLASGIRRAARVGLIIPLVVIAALGLVRERPASASHTQIFLSRIPPGQTQCVMPGWPATTVVALPGMQVQLCVWAKDVDDQQGLGAFEVGFTYNSDLVFVNGLNGDPYWLASTGRGVTCNPSTIQPDYLPGVGRATVGCFTAFAPPPFGPQGSGLLAKVLITAGQEYGITDLSFADWSFLWDTGKVNGGEYTYPELIPASVISARMRTTHCADFWTSPTNPPNGAVRMSDVTVIVNRYGTSDPEADLDHSGLVLSPDITIGVYQYGWDCA